MLRFPRQRVFRNYGLLLSAELVTSASGVLRAIVIARALGVKDYGTLALVTAFVLAVSEFFDPRVWETLTRFVPYFRARGQHEKAAATVQLCYLIEFAGAALAALFAMATADLAARVFLKSPDCGHFVYIGALLLLVKAPNETTAALLRVMDQFRPLSAQQTVVATLRLLGVGLVCAAGPSIAGLLLIEIVCVSLSAIVLLAITFRTLGQCRLKFWRGFHLGKLRGHWREILRYTLMAYVSAMSQMVSKADSLLVGWLVGPAAAGIYDLAKRVVARMEVLCRPLYKTIFPEFSRLVARGEFYQLTRLQWDLTRTALLTVIPFCLVVTLLAPWTIPYVFGQHFLPSALVLQILIWQLVQVPFAWFRALLMSTGHEMTMACVNWANSLLLLVLLSVLIPALPEIGAALAVTLCTLVWIAFSAVVVQQLNASGMTAQLEAAHVRPGLDVLRIQV